MINNAEPDMILEIGGTFDIALARNRLRKLIGDRSLPHMLSARASAALTVLSEMVLFKSLTNKGDFELAVRVLDGDDVQGIEFIFDAALTTDISVRFKAAEIQLERACDEISIHNEGIYDHIVMRLWNRRRNLA